jgi:hypothetical protein
MRLGGFLALLEAHGGGEIRVCELGAALAADGGEVRSALRAQGVVRDGPRAETVPCDGIGCARDVRELRRGAGRPAHWLGVCARHPAECETIEVGEADLAQEIVSREAFVAAVQRALRLAPVAGGATGEAIKALVPLGEEIGKAGAETRDVFLAWRWDARELKALVGERGAEARGIRLLTLTARAPDEIDLGARVEIESLSDLLTVRDGQIAELPRLAVVPPRISSVPAPPVPLVPPPRPPRSPALEGLRTIERWGEITLFDVDEDDLVGVTFDTRLRRLSCVDFGLATVDRRRPLDVFVLLKTICRGNGLFVTRAFGTASNGKRLMSELRKALRTTFGLASDPFEAYSRRTHNWKPKFRALAATPAEVAAARRELEG